MKHLCTILLMVLLTGCSKPKPPNQNRVHWQESSWTFADGTLITPTSLAQRRSHTLEIQKTTQGTIADAAPWIEDLKNGWKSIRLNNAPAIPLNPTPSPDNTALMLEIADSRVHGLINTATPNSFSLDPGQEIEQLTAALKHAGNPAGSCLIVLPDENASFSTFIQLLKLSQIPSPRPVSFLRDPNRSLLADVKIDPPPRPPRANPKHGIPLRITADGKTFLGDLPLEGDALSQLLHRFAAIEPKAHLRLHGEKDVIFKNSRALIRTAAEAGISNVVFVTHPDGSGDSCEKCKSRNLPDSVVKALQATVEQTIRPREKDLKLSLPKPDNDPNTIDLLVKLSKDGKILSQGMELDMEGFIKSLKTLQQQKLKPNIQLHAENETPQTEVIKLLDALAGIGIGSVTFVDAAD